MTSTSKEGRRPPEGVMDRRRAPRYLACFPVKLLPSAGVERLCVCQDMSRSGGRFLTQTRLKAGDPVRLEMFFGEDVSKPRVTTARVVRVKPRTDRNSFWLYDAAMTFEEPLADAEPHVRALSERQHRLGLYRTRRAPA